jgi:hypothetical protein
LVTEHLSTQGRLDPRGGLLRCFWCPKHFCPVEKNLCTEYSLVASCHPLIGLRQKVYSHIQYGVASCLSHTIGSKSRSQKSFTPESYTNVKVFFFAPPPGFVLAKFFFKVAKIYSLYMWFFFCFWFSSHQISKKFKTFLFQESPDLSNIGF